MIAVHRADRRDRVSPALSRPLEEGDALVPKRGNPTDEVVGLPVGFALPVTGEDLR